MTQEEYLQRLEQAAEKMLLAATKMETAIKMYADLSGMQSENFTRAMDDSALSYGETEFEKLKNSYYNNEEESPF